MATMKNTVALNVAFPGLIYEGVVSNALSFPTYLIAGQFANIWDTRVDGTYEFGYATGTADPIRPPMIVVTNQYCEGDVDTHYEKGDRVFTRAILPGDVVDAMCDDGQTLVVGHRLYLSTSVGGILRVVTNDIDPLQTALSFCVALEDTVTVEETRVKVMIIN